MAAKKAEAKSRTSKKSSRKTNLKWWYVLPVILVVAVSGYAIVRFSEAATLPGLKTVDSGINCSLGTIVTKTTGGAQDRVCSLPVGITASAVWYPSTIYKDNGYRSFCATVYFGANASASIRSSMSTIFPYKPSADWTRITKQTAGKYSICSGPWDDNYIGTWNTSVAAGLEVKNNVGTITVVNMYLKK